MTMHSWRSLVEASRQLALVFEEEEADVSDRDGAGRLNLSGHVAQRLDLAGRRSAADEGGTLPDALTTTNKDRRHRPAD